MALPWNLDNDDLPLHSVSPNPPNTFYPQKIAPINCRRTRTSQNFKRRREQSELPLRSLKIQHSPFQADGAQTTLSGIAIFTVFGIASTFAIPAARVARYVQEFEKSDAEKCTSIVVPPGTSRYSEYSQTWLYWIPCGPNRWLRIQSKNLTMLGRCTAEVLDDGQLSALLRAGNLHIRLTHVTEVKEIVKRSRVGDEALFNPLPGTT